MRNNKTLPANDRTNTTVKLNFTGWIESTLSKFIPNAPVIYAAKAIAQPNTVMAVLAISSWF